MVPLQQKHTQQHQHVRTQRDGAYFPIMVWFSSTEQTSQRCHSVRVLDGAECQGAIVAVDQILMERRPEAPSPSWQRVWEWEEQLDQ